MNVQKCDISTTGGLASKGLEKETPDGRFKLGIKSYGTVRLAKSKILVQMSISLFSKSYGKSL
jgi:hypothetical protein